MYIRKHILFNLSSIHKPICVEESGITTFTYDNLGNVLTKQTANLKKEGKTINYEYDYGRLVAINYPNHPENNVKYHYGSATSSNNRIGRLMLREDGSGAIEYYYGKMGEVLKTVRTLIVPIRHTVEV